MITGLSYGLYKGMMDNFLAEVVGMGEMDRMMSSVPSQASVPPAELQDELEEPEELVQPEQNEAPRETDDFGAGIFDEN